jgi:YHS domain-containing protein
MRINPALAKTMTTARQKRKQLCAALAVFVGLALVLAGVLAGGVPVSRAAVTERIVVDWHTGLAIGGFDPVAFFTDGKPMAGNAELEMKYGGAVWRFCNPGNRAAFASRPDVYMPKYGGYDPVGVARGVAVAGNPNVWRIVGDRLFLFYDRGRLEKFAADPDRVIGSADRKWLAVERALTP